MSSELNLEVLPLERHFGVPDDPKIQWPFWRSQVDLPIQAGFIYDHIDLAIMVVMAIIWRNGHNGPNGLTHYGHK